MKQSALLVVIGLLCMACDTNTATASSRRGPNRGSGARVSQASLAKTDSAEPVTFVGVTSPFVVAVARQAEALCACKDPACLKDVTLQTPPELGSLLQKHGLPQDGADNVAHDQLAKQMAKCTMAAMKG